MQQAYQRTSSYVCNTEVTPAFLESAAIETAQYAIGGDPVSATGGGRTVTVNMVAPVWLRTGSLASFGVLTHTPGLGFSDYFNGIEVRNYDMAGIARDWRVG